MATASDQGWPLNPATVRVACPGIPLNLHPAVAPLFAELIRRIDAVKGAGFMQSSGGKNVRAVRGYEDRYARLLKRGAVEAAEELLSNHSWALAGDFRAGTNPQRANGPTDMPANTAQICADISPHLSWGGSWGGSRRDPMHFEYLGTPAQAAADVARLTAPTQEDDLDANQAKMLQEIHDELFKRLPNRVGPNASQEGDGADTILGFAANADGYGTRIERYLHSDEFADRIATRLLNATVEPALTMKDGNVTSQKISVTQALTRAQEASIIRQRGEIK